MTPSNSLLRVTVLILLSLLAPSQVRAHGDHEQADVDTAIHVDKIDAANPWTSLDLLNDPDMFQFAIVTDRTGGNRPGVFAKAVTKLNLLLPEFVMSVGDLVQGYTEDADKLRRQRDEFDSLVGQLEMPFFYVAGNHDISNPIGESVWVERLGRAYYHFRYRDVLFLCLCTEDPPGTPHISAEQADWAVKVMADNADARWTFVFMHQPIWRYLDEDPNLDDTGHWPTIQAALDQRKHTVFAGHWHHYTRHERNDSDYYILATTGGGRATEFEYPESGYFDHIVWVTMTDDGPRIANLLLNGILDKNIVTGETNAKALQMFGNFTASGISFQPIFLEDDGQTSHTLHGRIINRSDFPMDVWAGFEPHPALQSGPLNLLGARIEPGQEQAIDVSLHTDEPLAADGIAPLILEWIVTFESPDGRPLMNRQQQRVPIVKREIHPCPRQLAPVVIDGNLDDWADLPFVVEQPGQILKDATSWTGPDDCSYRFAVAYDDQNLYVAVKTIDDVVINDKGDEPWKQDGPEIRIDARPDPDRSMGKGNTDFKETLLLALVPTDTADRKAGYQLDQLPDGVQFTCVKTDTGYAIEAAIPNSYLDECQGKPWDMFRLDVAINDLDLPDGQGAQLHWVPDWRTDENSPGSGTFQRQ